MGITCDEYSTGVTITISRLYLEPGARIGNSRDTTTDYKYQSRDIKSTDESTDDDENYYYDGKSTIDDDEATSNNTK